MLATLNLRRQLESTAARDLVQSATVIDTCGEWQALAPPHDE